MTEYFQYELVYLLLFLYLGFEGFKDLFIRFGEKHLQLKDKLKNQKDENYFVYKIKTLFLPIIYSFKSTKVITIIIFCVVHNFFILEILYKAGYEVTVFSNLSQIGMFLAAIFAAIISYSESSNIKLSAKSHSEETLNTQSDYRKLYFKFLKFHLYPACLHRGRLSIH